MGFKSIALLVPATVELAVALFTFNARVPEHYTPAPLYRLDLPHVEWLVSRGELSRSNQANEYRAARLIRSSLCDHGFVQRCGLVSRQRSVRISHQSARNFKPGAVGRCLEKQL